MLELPGISNKLTEAVTTLGPPPSELARTGRNRVRQQECSTGKPNLLAPFLDPLAPFSRSNKCQVSLSVEWLKGVSVEVKFSQQSCPLCSIIISDVDALGLETAHRYVALLDTSI